jgi:hypothetical protein
MGWSGRAPTPLLGSGRGRELKEHAMPQKLNSTIAVVGNDMRRGNRDLRALFVQAAWVVLVKVEPKQWERYGLKSWIEAAKKRLHHNVLAIALANKLARIAWAVLNKGRAFECMRAYVVAPPAA